MTKAKFIAIGCAVAVGTIGLSAAALGGQGGSGATGPAPADGSPVQFSRERGPVQAFGQDLAQGLRSLSSAVPAVSNPVIRPATDPGAVGLELSFDLAVASSDGADIARPMWAAHLFAGAVADKIAASGRPPLVSVGATLVLPDGTRQPIGGGLGTVVRDQRFRTASDEVSETIRVNAKAAGFEDVTVSTMAIIQDALIITATAEDPKAAVGLLRSGGSGTLAGLLGTRPADFEGVYFEVRDETGAPAYIEAVAPRAGAGMAWSDAGLGLRLGKGQLRR